MILRTTSSPPSSKTFNRYYLLNKKSVISYVILKTLQRILLIPPSMMKKQNLLFRTSSLNFFPRIMISMKCKPKIVSMPFSKSYTISNVNSLNANLILKYITYTLLLQPLQELVLTPSAPQKLKVSLLTLLKIQPFTELFFLSKLMSATESLLERKSKLSSPLTSATSKKKVLLLLLSTELLLTTEKFTMLSPLSPLRAMSSSIPA